MIVSAIAIIVTFSIVVFVHELGHFIVALRSGVCVETFSLGFGPRILGFKYRAIDFKVSAIPLGGYVKMKGEDPDDSRAAEPDSFAAQSPLKRIGIVAAGPLMNFIAGMLIISVIIYAVGLPRFLDKPVIGAVSSGSPAEEAGLKAGDRVISIDGARIDSWLALTDAISSAQGPVSMSIEREKKIMDVEVTPRMNPEVGRALIGITASFENVRLGLFRSVAEGARYTVFLCWQLMVALWLIITGKMAAAVSGPVGIAQVVSHAAGQGVNSLFQLIAVISINLGFINLLPIPILDGGHIMFALIEKVKGSPLDPKKVNIANMAGLTFLLFVLLFYTWKDILKLAGQ